MDLKEEKILGGAVGEHWYYASKAAALNRYLAGILYRRSLDVGSGSGFFTRHLLTTTSLEEGLCVDTGYAQDRDEWVGGKPMRKRRAYHGEPADLALFMDVLEHVDDDTGLLTFYADRLPRGAHVFITVPAFGFLWSGHDVFLGHRRRYTLASLEETVRSARLSVLRASYYFGFVFPIVAARRIMSGLRHNRVTPRSDLQRHPALVNAALRLACAAELPVLRYNRLAGLSVFCLAEKS